MVVNISTLTSSPIPRIEISCSLTGQVLILPNTLHFIKEALLKQGDSKLIGGLKIFRIVKNQIESEEYIEDEQLYKANESNQEELSDEIEIHQINGINIIVTPNFQDVINYEIIARDIIKFPNIEILTITPGTLPFNCNIAEIGSNSTNFPQLSPPFIITGISASLVSNSKTQSKNNIQTLVLQSEGVSGFEKINNDSINELAHYLQDKFKLNSNFIKHVESLVNTGSSVNNFGLYI
ncbi:unnamed protein product [Wickerhamomyces anomalus]